MRVRVGVRVRVRVRVRVGVRVRGGVMLGLGSGLGLASAGLRNLPGASSPPTLRHAVYSWCVGRSGAGEEGVQPSSGRKNRRSSKSKSTHSCTTQPSAVQPGSDMASAR